MDTKKKEVVKLSVRTLVEFILRSGSIESGSGSGMDVEAMQLGSKLHRKIQRRMGSNYKAEVPLSITLPMDYKKGEYDLILEGRADGILTEERTIVDEIKTMYQDISLLEEPYLLHRAQVMCYAYIYARSHELSEIGIRLTYCNIETEATRFFDELLSYETLETWFLDLIHQYEKWATWQLEWKDKRNESIKESSFPFSYRPGQKDLVKGVYQTITRQKKLYIEAPTGVGKTISTMFPAIKTMEEEKTEKIFYLTAKTITRTVAQNTVQLLTKRGLKLKAVTITAKEKICPNETIVCNKEDCQRANGHFDRVNDAMYDLLVHENEISRELLESYATKHMVCPFEMALDISLWSDFIICDYNYVFDPNVYLRRFFLQEKKQNYVFLVDEAHNLVERAREMYSETIVKEEFLRIKKIMKEKSKKIERKLEQCNQDLLKKKRNCETYCMVHDIEEFILHVLRLLNDFDEYLKEVKEFEGKDEVMEFYFNLRHFINIYELVDEKYVMYCDYTEAGEFRLTLKCMDPSTNLLRCLEKGRSAIFFSATLLPIQYYKEQLAGTKDDYEMYAKSPFQQENRLLMVGDDVSTKYTRRNAWEYKKIAEYIEAFIKSQTGNYLVFAPSYQMLKDIYQQLEFLLEGSLEVELFQQKSQMSELEKEEFLNHFQPDSIQTKVGFCVMGGIFGEGIDLTGNRLIGAVIVGTGLPMVCTERELYRQFFEEKKGMGFDYAYLYPGMNKVLQSAGRVIRTATDKGAILLLDERFLQSSYQRLFPREWFPYKVVKRERMKETLEQFWEEHTNEKSSDL